MENKLTTKQWNAINTIMDSFDFNKVANHIKSVNWKWCMSDGFEVPTESAIRKIIRKRLINIYSNLNEFINSNPDWDDSYLMESSGGFTIYVHKNDVCHIYFSIEDYWLDEDMLE